MKNVKQHELLASFRDGCLKYDHFDMRRGHDLLRNHPKEPQCIFNRLFLIRRADQHLCALGLRFVVAFALDNPMLSFHLRDVQRRDVQAGLFLHARLNLAIGRLAFGLGDGELVCVDADLDDIIRILLDQ